MRNTDLSARSRRLYGLLGVCAVAACGFGAYLGVRQSHPGSTYVQAVFGRAGQGLDGQSEVKIRGINVGSVDSVKLTGAGRIRVRLRLDNGVHVPVTASLAIQPLSVFGPKYIDLEPGSGEGTGPYLRDGATVASTSDPQELTDIIQPAYALLNAVSPDDLNTILHTFSTGMTGRGQELGDTIDSAAKLLDLSEQNTQNLKALIANGGALAGTLSDRGGELTALAGDLNKVGPAVTGDPAALSALLSGTADLSGRVTDVLNSDPGGPGRIITSLVPALKIYYDSRATTPMLISAVGGFFNQSAGILQAKGPNGSLLGTETVHLDASDPICTLFLGLCRPYPKALPYPKIGGR
jgi:phospholipid/cholesterol/gamma-HCH transport system substrate-binding protein